MTAIQIANQPAFPRVAHPELTCEELRPEEASPQPGMTYRQWLVGMALQGLLAAGGGVESAELAVTRADKTILALLHGGKTRGEQIRDRFENMEEDV